MRVQFTLSFFEAYSALEKSTQKKIRDLLKVFLEDKVPSGSLEKLRTSKGFLAYSARIDDNFRTILSKGQSDKGFIFLWVDKHDEAYKWLENQNAALLDGDNEFCNLLRSANKDNNLGAGAIFESFDDDVLKKLGIPPFLLPVVRELKYEWELDDLETVISRPIYNTLFYLYLGLSPLQIIEEREKALQVETHTSFRRTKKERHTSTDFVIEQGLEIGCLIRGKYEIQGLVGKDPDGSSVIYKVKDTHNLFIENRAIKYFLQNGSRVEQIIENELNVRQCVFHENISRCFGVDHLEDTDQKFLIVEYHPGQTWEQWASGRVTDRYFLSQIKEYALQVLKGLDALHSHGFVHGNIALGNIVIGTDNKVKIVSFDYSGQITAELPYPLIPSPYWPPDLIRTGRHPSQDTFGLGVALYKLVFDCLPTVIGIGNSAREKFFPDKIPGAVNKQLVKIIGKACDPRAEFRYSTAKAMFEDLKSLVC